MTTIQPRTGVYLDGRRNGRGTVARGLTVSSNRPLWLALMILALLLSVLPTHAQNFPPSRPILFVHGWCGSPSDWAPLFSSLFQTLPGSMYPNHTVYYVLYDSVANTIHFWYENPPITGTSTNFIPIAENAIQPDARFFVIELFDPNLLSIDPVNVTKISILNKAFEISQVLKHITAITQIPRVNILAHSMGGLDSRAYVEGMASPGACYDYFNNIPKYSAACNPGAPGAAYANDVANIITIDTPHTGSTLAKPNDLAGAIGIEPACQAYSSTNMTELAPLSQAGSGLIEALNYNGSPISGVLPSKNSVPIQAVEDYFTDVLHSWTGLSGQSDDIVT